MTTTIGWYGPLIDLSKASSHVGDYVQLLVFVHKSTPIQYKLRKGGEIVRTDIQVGDDSRPFFSVSIWQKQMRSTLFAGNLILLHNVMVTSFGDVVEAKTVQHSSLQCLVRSYESIFSKGADNLIEDCRVGITVKEKLRKVIDWVIRAGPTLHNVELHSYQKRRQPLINWKVHDETQSQDCFSLSEVLRLTDSCKATFCASVSEIFLPITWKHLNESEEEFMFIKRRLCMISDKNLADDLICNGCQLCGAPLNCELGHRSSFKQDSGPLYCQKSSNHLHIVSLIYRPFMLYVWDASKYIPLLVTNKAAEVLFGNISAESVYTCYKSQKHSQILDTNAVQPNTAEGEMENLRSPVTEKTLGQEGKHRKIFNFYMIWLILLKTLLLQEGKNSPLRFKVRVNPSIDCESGRYEMVSVSMAV